MENGYPDIKRFYLCINVYKRLYPFISVFYKNNISACFNFTSHKTVNQRCLRDIIKSVV